jgi:prevent-host-death family protein
MARREETMTTVAARERLSEVLNRAAFGKERVVLTRRGKRLAAVVPMEDIERLEALEDRRDAAQIQDRLKQLERGGRPTVPLTEVVRKHRRAARRGA